MKKVVALTVLLIVFFVIGWRVRAQAAQSAMTVPWQVTVTGPHTQCTPNAATTSFCFAADGFYQSINGAAFVQVGIAGPAGPQGVQGIQGPAGPPGPAGNGGVVSVNGKTGVVTLAIQ